MKSLEIYDKALIAVYETGRKLKKHFGNAPAKKYKSWHPADVVTELDEESELYLEKELAKIDPGIGFKGEEFGRKLDASRYWLTDPIDGTGFFMRGIYGCTTMLALVNGQDIEFSAIYDFVNDEMFWAQKGKGAFNNKKRISVSNRPLSDAFVYFESQLATEETRSIFYRLRNKCMMLGSYPSGIYFARVAEGKADARIVLDGFGKDYDHAPGMLLVKEAGGIVANIGKDSLDIHDLSFIASNPLVYKDLTRGKEALFPVPAGD